SECPPRGLSEKRECYFSPHVGVPDIKLVVRRGQVCYLWLVLPGALQSWDSLNLQAKSWHLQNTVVVLCPRSSAKHHRWQATNPSESGVEVKVAVSTPLNTIVGKYHLQVKSGNKHIFKHEENILYILFTTWCEEDMVFVAAEGSKMSTSSTQATVTQVSLFTQVSVKEKPWNFRQFEKNILNCCIYLLSQSPLETMELKDSVLVSRAVCALGWFGVGPVPKLPHGFPCVDRSLDEVTRSA
ncbi:hypothetical protein HPG69_012895, partial [Diceros bicornis minor]